MDPASSKSGSCAATSRFALDHQWLHDRASLRSCMSTSSAVSEHGVHHAGRAASRGPLAAADRLDVSVDVLSRFLGMKSDARQAALCSPPAAADRLDVLDLAGGPGWPAIPLARALPSARITCTGAPSRLLIISRSTFRQRGQLEAQVRHCVHSRTARQQSREAAAPDDLCACDVLLSSRQGYQALCKVLRTQRVSPQI